MAEINIIHLSPGDNETMYVLTDSESNSTNDNQTTRDSDMAKIEIAVQSVILFLAIFGNLCVLFALARGKKVRSRMHMFIMHLSIADLLVAFFNVLPQLMWDISFRFEGGDFLCRFVKYMQLFVMYLTSYVLVMTAIDRYLAICHPLSTHTWTTRTVNVMVLGAYLISGILSIPQAVLFKYQRISADSDVYDCWVHFDPPWILQLYITMFTFAVYIIPFFILLFTYGSICYTIWRKHRFTQNNVTKREENGVKCKLVYEVQNYSSCNTATHTNEKDTARRYRRHNGTPHPRTHSVRGFSRAKLKTIKLTFVVIAAYLVCWSPFFISQLWWLFDETAADNNALVIMILLASLNSCCNPWIYLAFSGNLLRHLCPCFNSVCSATAKQNQTWSQSNTDTKHKTIELDRLHSKGTIAKRMESFTSLFSTKKRGSQSLATPSSPRRSIPSEKSSSRSDENSRSPHVKKRARVHERPREEVREAQMKWERGMGSENSPNQEIPGLQMHCEISDDELFVKPDIPLSDD